MSPFAKDLPFNIMQNVKQYLLYHFFYITTMLQNFRRKICWHGIKWESQALLLHLHKITSPADKLGQKHCILTSDNRSASHFRVGYIYTTNKHFMIILPKSLNAEVFGKCYQFWRNKKKIHRTVQIRYLQRSQQIQVKRQSFPHTIPKILNQSLYLSKIFNYQLMCG